MMSNIKYYSAVIGGFLLLSIYIAVVLGTVISRIMSSTTLGQVLGWFLVFVLGLGGLGILGICLLYIIGTW